MFLLTKLTDLLPARLRPYAKATWPALTALTAAGTSWVATGNLDTTEIRTTVGGLALALITLAVPNR